MNAFTFDSIIPREGTGSIKYDRAAYKKPPDVLPLWVADMDFPAPDCVLEALREQVNHGIFGYSDTGLSYFETLYKWFYEKFDWNIKYDWLVKTPGVVNAIYIAVRAFSEKGDAVLIQQPVYYPFMRAVEQNERVLIVNELIHETNNEKGRYGIDFDDFEACIRRHHPKLFILCSPHNPVGRVWTRAELLRMAEICLKHNVLILSDEIHEDFVFEGHKHFVFANLDPAVQRITVTCTAPSKTFNLAGLQISNIFIADDTLRARFQAEYARGGLAQVSIMGAVACQAAYRNGDPWLQALLAYLDGNFETLAHGLNPLPGVGFHKPEGTYLAWLDFRGLGLKAQELDDFVTHRVGLWLNNGLSFGASGEGFMRLNAACPRSRLQDAINRLAAALS
jgi:cystathionine beta-lyase